MNDYELNKLLGSSDESENKENNEKASSNDPIFILEEINRLTKSQEKIDTGNPIAPISARMILHLEKHLENQRNRINELNSLSLKEKTISLENENYKEAMNNLLEQSKTMIVDLDDITGLPDNDPINKLGESFTQLYEHLIKAKENNTTNPATLYESLKKLGNEIQNNLNGDVLEKLYNNNLLFRFLDFFITLLNLDRTTYKEDIKNIYSSLEKSSMIIIEKSVAYAEDSINKEKTLFEDRIQQIEKIEKDPKNNLEKDYQFHTQKKEYIEFDKEDYSLSKGIDLLSEETEEDTEEDTDQSLEQAAFELMKKTHFHSPNFFTQPPTYQDLLTLEKQKLTDCIKLNTDLLNKISTIKNSTNETSNQNNKETLNLLRFK